MSGPAPCCSFMLPTKSFTQLLVSRQLLSYTNAAPLWAWLQPHCLLAYEILSAQQSERTVTHRECVHLWEQRKWTTQEPLSQPIVQEPAEVGGMRGKWCLKNEGQSSQRWSVCVCVCVCVHIYTYRTQVRHLVDQDWQGYPQIVLDLWKRKSLSSNTQSSCSSTHHCV